MLRRFFTKTNHNTIAKAFYRSKRQQRNSVVYNIFSSSFSSTSSSNTTTTGSIKEEFEKKIILGKKLPPLDDNFAKLQMYALFKQAQNGPNHTSKPGMLDFVGKAKWDAWTKLGQMSQEEAMKKYIEIIDELAQKAGVVNKSSSSTGTTTTNSTFGEDLFIQTSEKDTLLTIQLNRPSKYNALNREMYHGIMETLEKANTNHKIKVIVLTSSGSWFSSGNDLSMFTPRDNQETIEQMAEEGADILERFVNSFLNCSKPIVAKVQGPSVGIATTLLALCDLVYIHEKATFHTPFTSLGQTPEACSSFLFPWIMGKAQANRMLLLGEKMTSSQAIACGFATESFGPNEFDSKVQEKIQLLLKQYPHSVQLTKKLIQNPQFIKSLQQVNQEECQVLKKKWLSDECMDAIMNFQNRK